ncbi:MAG: methenyltetrahydrofolate cyclohydrolase [Planctomycetes bacterium]|nr:methenyltetrahydrofolate cyclohydrolase [Planctomycetota bacterium]
MEPAATVYARLPFDQLVEQLAARTPTPGGGTGAALAGALGAALGCMALRFSLGKKGGPGEHDAVLGEIERGLLAAAAQLSRLADEDAAAFEAVRSARKLPQGTEAEKAARAAAVAAANDHSAAVPLQTAKSCREAMECLDGALAVLNTRLATDAGSGALLLRAGARCAAWNVLVNLVGDGSAAAAARRAEVARLLARAAELETRIVAWTDAALQAGG